MPQNVMITGAGKAVGLGFNLVLRYLEAGDTVVATIRNPCPELDELQKRYGERLIALTMDISSTASVQESADALSEKLDHLDLLVRSQDYWLRIRLLLSRIKSTWGSCCLFPQ